jgi:AsmA protein
LVKIILAALVLVILVIVLVPLFVNGSALRPTVESRLTAALNRQVTIGSLSFSLLAGGLVAKDIAIADDPAFNPSPFLKAAELRVGVEVMPLLFHHEVRITSLTIDTPSIRLIQNQAGKWNYSSIGGNASRRPQPASSGPDLSASLTVDRLQIKNGSVVVSSVPPTARPLACSSVTVDVKQFAFGNNFPFELSAALPGGGSVKVNGTAGPIPEQDASQTPVNADIQITHLDPVQAGLVEASKGISGIADINAKITSDGATISSSGKVKAANLQLSRAGSPAPQPVEVDYKTTLDRRTRSGRVENLSFRSGSDAATVTGTFRFTTQAVLVDLHLAAPNMPIDSLEKLLPAVGIKLPAGSHLQGGNLNANLTITGPATDTTIAGPVEIDNTRLAGFDLGSRIEGLGLIKPAATGTDIQKLSATLNAAPQITAISNIDAELPQLGSATGSGTVSPAGALDFKMVATLNNSNIVGDTANKVMNQAVNQVTGMLGGLLGGNRKPAATNTPRGIPLIVSGTSTDPKIRANLGAMLPLR